AGQWAEMRKLCRETPLPIALDEELIGTKEKELLLDTLNPQHIILKPTLLGGFLETQQWISLAEERGIGWWMTSALESNIGLNAISQLASSYDPQIPQGLGTGKLYHNNLSSSLEIQKGQIRYGDEVWENPS
ncbi:MAG: o-succinylbenzoate synthase, partial [Cytophagales bacterium]